MAALSFVKRPLKLNNIGKKWCFKKQKVSSSCNSVNGNYSGFKDSSEI